jgi:23S rRNA pseudouridine2457 synthase
MYKLDSMPSNKFIYIAFHKPYGVLCQFTSEEGVQTLASYQLPKDVYPVGRLDKDSEGLLILSNDGAFIDLALSPKYNKEKTYLAQVENIPTEDSLNLLRKGNIKIENYFTKPCQAKLLPDFLMPEREPPIRTRKTIPTAWIEITLTEGKNRQVRKMTASINHPTLRLIRKKFGKFDIGNLTSGQWIEISKSDIL